MATTPSIDGMTLAEAVGLCMRRHDELRNTEAAFLARFSVSNKKLADRDLVRLTGIVRRLRQDALFTPRVPDTAFTCPHCGRISYNIGDIANQFCGACHKFMADAPPPEAA